MAIFNWADWLDASRGPIAGEACDLLGRRVPSHTYRIDTATGLVTHFKNPLTWRTLPDGTEDLVSEQTQMVPPITVWLYF